MDAICYVCNKQTTDLLQKFSEIKSQHTQTPIADFLRQFLGDFTSLRNIDDEFNCICSECSQQINSYDLMRHQANEQETKLCGLLLETEITLAIKLEPTEIGEEVIEDSHNEMDFADELNDIVSESKIKHERNSDEFNCEKDVREEQTATIPLPSPQQTVAPSQQASTGISLPNNTSTTSPTLQSNRDSNQNKSNESIGIPKTTTPMRMFDCVGAKKSRYGALLASEIYNFISVHFPYFKTADNWKNSVRSSLNNHFERIEHTSVDGVVTKSYLWTMRTSEIKKIDENIQNCLRFQSMNIRSAMAKSEHLPALIRGDMKHGNIARESTKANEIKENEIEDGSHNRLHGTVNDFKSNADVVKIHAAQPTPKLQQPPTICLISKNSLNPVPVLQSNRKRKIITIPKSKEAIQQSAEEILPITKIATTTNLNEISSSVDTAVPSLSSTQHHGTPANSTKELKYPKPALSYICLIALALKNSHTGSLPVSEIYRFICEHFPYFRTASALWKCSVRSELADCFEKVDPKSDNRVLTKRYLWTMRSSEIKKFDEKIQNCLRRESMNIRGAMAKPEHLPALIRGDMKHRYITRLNDFIVSENENESADSPFINEECVQSDNDDKSGTFDAVNADDSKLFPNKLSVEDSQLKFQMIRKRAQHDNGLSTELKLRMEENEIEDDSHKESITANGLRMMFEDGFKPNTDVEKIHVIQPTLKLPHPPTLCSISKNSSKLIPVLQLNRKRKITSAPKPKDAVRQIDKEIPSSTTAKLNEISSSVDTAIPSSSSSSSSTPANSMAVLKYPKPPFQYSCFIALALKNSRTGSLTVAEIYSFMCEHFPYFRTASYTWKHSVRSELSSRFDKIEDKTNDGVITKKSLWTMRPSEISDIDGKTQKFCNDFSTDVRKAMANPEHLPSLIRGDMKHGHLNDNLAGLDGTVDSENGNGPAEYGQRSRLDNNDSSIAPKRIKTSTASITSKSQSQKFNGTETQSQRPPFSFSYLIAMALRNSSTGSLLVSEIYRFICTRFPYFKTATEDWKHNIRGTLTSTKYFMEIEHKTGDGASSKRCLWSMNPMYIKKLNKKIQKWSQNADGCDSMTVPESLHGEMKHGNLCDNQFEAGGAREPIVNTEDNSQIDCDDDVSNMFGDLESLAEGPSTLDNDQGQPSSTSKHSRLNSLISSNLTPKPSNISTAM